MTAATIVGWCGFLGAWLLVAGPLYQGVLELRDEDADQTEADPGPRAIAPPPPPSIWWWFLPPVMLVLRRRRSAEYHRTVLASLTPGQRAHRARFIQKATGWFVVALGGSFLAVKETWELSDLGGWPRAVFAAVLIGVFVLVGAHTVLQAGRRPRADRG